MRYADAAERADLIAYLQKEASSVVGGSRLVARMSQIAFFTRDGDMRGRRSRISRPKKEGALIRATSLIPTEVVTPDTLLHHVERVPCRPEPAFGKMTASGGVANLTLPAGSTPTACCIPKSDACKARGWRRYASKSQLLSSGWAIRACAPSTIYDDLRPGQLADGGDLFRAFLALR